MAPMVPRASPGHRYPKARLQGNRPDRPVRRGSADPAPGVIASTAMQFHQLLARTQLEDRFGSVLSREGSLSVTSKDLVGARYRSLLTEMTEIVWHQWRSGIRRGAIKGFFLSGPPGVGKTSLALRVAYELSLRAGADAPDDGADDGVVVALIDGGDIARSRYGESEERLREVFTRAQKGFTEPNQRTIVLFDDVESILMARGSSNAKEWHFSQDSVFFHSVDELDTSRTAVFLTSNRPDLVDDAIRDRFLAYPLGSPDVDLLVEVARRRAEEHQFTAAQQERLAERIRSDAAGGDLRSVREAERLVVRQYIEDVLGRESLAHLGEG
jgi:SpoVK/Ycf46/Vps4 family AAA+-type ATPase